MTGGSSSSLWVATRVQLEAITGIADSHTAPFLRVLYTRDDDHDHGDDDHDDNDNDNEAMLASESPERVVSMELPEDRDGDGARPSWTRVAGGGCSARWPRQDQACALFLPTSVAWIQVQVWNRFDADVSVFLGAFRLAVHAFHKEMKQQPRLSPPHQTYHHEAAAPGTTRTMWYPLEECGPHNRDTVSVQLTLSIVEDARASRIHTELLSRHHLHHSQQQENKQLDVNNGIPAATTSAAIADPSFAFTEPDTRINWNDIVAINLRRVFRTGAVDELLLFHDDVLHGDLNREMVEDGQLLVHDHHAMAFRFCQLSAQYLTHCRQVLCQRASEYDEHGTRVRAQRRKLRQRRRELLHHKTCLQRQHDQLALLVSTHEKLMQSYSPSPSSSLPPSLSSPPLPSTIKRVPLPSAQMADDEGNAPPPCSSASVSPAKSPIWASRPMAASGLSWEDRERMRQQHKQDSRARRIADEQARLVRVFEERRQREQQDLALASISQRKQEDGVRRLQRQVRGFLVRRGLEDHARRQKAAVRVQASVRRWRCTRRWSQERARRLQERERRGMESCDRETKIGMQYEQKKSELERELEREQQQEQVLVDDGREQEQITGEPQMTIAPTVLAATWTRLRRILLRASVNTGISEAPTAVASLFNALDTRQDGVLDRYELRLGARQLGLRMDRQLTRSLLALARARAAEPPRPLTLSLSQFILGFGLSRRPAPSGPAGSCSLPDSSEINSNLPVPHIAPEPNPTEQECDHERHVEARSQSIEIASLTLAQLRQRILEAATGHVHTQHPYTKGASEFHSFRRALVAVVASFDHDQSGALERHELAACLSEWGCLPPPEQLDLLMDSLAHSSSMEPEPTIRISELVSFALMDDTQDRDMLSAAHLRGALLAHVRAARDVSASASTCTGRSAFTLTPSQAAAVVFQRAFADSQRLTSSPTQWWSPRRVFVRELARLQLKDVTEAQLSRLVLHLDRNGDGVISFPELLQWLRLRSDDSNDAVMHHGARAPDGSASIDASSTRHRVQELRAWVLQLAGAFKTMSTPSGHHPTEERLTAALFQRMDTNDSGKLSALEMQAFFSKLEQDHPLPDAPLTTTPGRSCSSAELAEELLAAIDRDNHGVVSLHEWQRFLATNDDDHDDGDDVAIERVRHELWVLTDTADGDRAQALRHWMRELPGAITTDGNVKIRVHEFQTALRLRLTASSFSVSGASSLPPALAWRKALARVVVNLDADASGWVTDSELCAWVLPERDLEALTHCLAQRWRREMETERDANGDVALDAFAVSLYERLDCDRNGVLARNELRTGLRGCFQVDMSLLEVAKLIETFDADGDGCWNRHEFIACVKQLVGGRADREIDRQAEMSTVTQQEVMTEPTDEAAGNDYDEDGEGWVEEEEESSSAYSLSQSEDASTKAPPSGPVAYSDDFDDT